MQMAIVQQVACSDTMLLVTNKIQDNSHDAVSKTAVFQNFEVCASIEVCMPLKNGSTENVLAVFEQTGLRSRVVRRYW
jgi:hypothetical protein